MIIINIFLTGEKQVGKSTLLNNVINELNLKPVGFKTLPYYIENKRKGFYLHSLIPIDPSLDNLPISVQAGTACLPQTDCFELGGCAILKASLNQINSIILMDELGTLERHATQFMQQVICCLDSDQLVLGVLKKTDSSFLEQIKHRSDTIVMEITVDNREKMCNILKELLLSTYN